MDSQVQTYVQGSTVVKMPLLFLLIIFFRISKSTLLPSVSVLVNQIELTFDFSFDKWSLQDCHRYSELYWSLSVKYEKNMTIGSDKGHIWLMISSFTSYVTLAKSCNFSEPLVSSPVKKNHIHSGFLLRLVKYLSNWESILPISRC